MNIDGYAGVDKGEDGGMGDSEWLGVLGPDYECGITEEGESFVDVLVYVIGGHAGVGIVFVVGEKESKGGMVLLEE